MENLISATNDPRALYNRSSFLLGGGGGGGVTGDQAQFHAFSLT